ncbi:hypothetical protein PVAP13_3KG296800 [Panicum virgatum]|uniref:Uncharacterized protein n=1 Tax=Panicum virgatum TaxID=38727 RepID=A0A8T0UP03_PANVG|nr:hypothetical protein PVAP13_3KG296800 [Panicum virgatum]
MAMDGSSSSDGGNRRNGKRAAGKGYLDRLMREPKRGVGIAKLEKMRVEEEMMKDKHLRNPFSRAQISGPAGIGLQGMMSYGPNGNMRGLFIVPLARHPSPSEAAAAAAANVNQLPSYTAPTRTLQLFPEHKEDEHGDCKGAASNNAHDNPRGLDLELRL